MKKCPLHHVALVNGKCPMCQMTAEQALGKTRQTSTSDVVPTPAHVATDKPVEASTSNASPNLLDAIKEQMRQLEGRLKLVENREAVLHDKLVGFGRDLDKIGNDIELLSRSVNVVQSIALLHSQEMATIERLLGYMHLEREFLAQAVGLKSVDELKAWVEERRTKQNEIPSPTGPIAPEEPAPRTEHDETLPVDA